MSAERQVHALRLLDLRANLLYYTLRTTRVR